MKIKNKIDEVKKQKKFETLSKSLKLEMGNTDDLHPSFCFRYLVNGFDFENLLRKDVKYLKEFILKIKNISKMSWREIERTSRYANGTEKIKVNEIKHKLPKGIEDEEYLIVFHLSNLFRLIGLRDGKVFYVLFIDVDGEVYKH